MAQWPIMALHRALRRMAGLVFLFVLWVQAGACQRDDVGVFLNVQFSFFFFDADGEWCLGGARTHAGSCPGSRVPGFLAVARRTRGRAFLLASLRRRGRAVTLPLPYSLRWSLLPPPPLSVMKKKIATSAPDHAPVAEVEVTTGRSRRPADRARCARASSERSRSHTSQGAARARRGDCDAVGRRSRQTTTNERRMIRRIDERMTRRWETTELHANSRRRQRCESERRRRRRRTATR